MELGATLTAVMAALEPAIRAFLLNPSAEETRLPSRSDLALKP